MRGGREEGGGRRMRQLTHGKPLSGGRVHPWAGQVRESTRMQAWGIVQHPAHPRKRSAGGFKHAQGPRPGRLQGRCQQKPTGAGAGRGWRQRAGTGAGPTRPHSTPVRRVVGGLACGALV